MRWRRQFRQFPVCTKSPQTKPSPSARSSQLWGSLFANKRNLWLSITKRGKKCLAPTPSKWLWNEWNGLSNFALRWNQLETFLHYFTNWPKCRIILGRCLVSHPWNDTLGQGRSAQCGVKVMSKDVRRIMKWLSLSRSLKSSIEVTTSLNYYCGLVWCTWGEIVSRKFEMFKVFTLICVTVSGWVMFALRVVWILSER